MTSPLDETTARHRDDFAEYLAALDPATERLYGVFHDHNRQHFAGQLVPPYLLLAEPSTPQRLGDCTLDAHGLRGRIRIRPSLLAGTHPDTETMTPANRARLTDDVLLHELIHLWQYEVDGRTDDGYHGHGPSFAEKANAIGVRLALPRVRTSKRRGVDKDLPSCSQWPHNVRPTRYYGVPTSRDAPDSRLTITLDRIRRDVAAAQRLIDDGEVFYPDSELTYALSELAHSLTLDDE
jgi:hypothetical protein